VHVAQGDPHDEDVLSTLIAAEQYLRPFFRVTSITALLTELTEKDTSGKFTYDSADSFRKLQIAEANLGRIQEWFSDSSTHTAADIETTLEAIVQRGTVVVAEVKGDVDVSVKFNVDKHLLSGVVRTIEKELKGSDLEVGKLTSCACFRVV
jgi:hypothetical protein